MTTKRKKAKRASYREGVAWIALNDEPTERDPAEMAGMISVCLLADLFCKPAEEVAGAVIRYREKNLWEPEGETEAEQAQATPLAKWLDEVHALVQKKPAFYYASNRLGSPNFDNAIDALCYEKGMSPQEALNWWRKQ